MTLGWTNQDAKILNEIAISLQRIAMAHRDIADVMLAQEVERAETERLKAYVEPAWSCAACGWEGDPVRTRYMGDPADRLTCQQCAHEEVPV